MTTTTSLDLRALHAPEPLKRVLDALDDLAPGEILQVLLVREPYPLYRILERAGWRHHADWQVDGSCLVRIGRET